MNIRSLGLSSEPAFRAHIRQRLGFKLGKFAKHVERVTVRFEDVNGFRGGIDKSCRVKAVLSGRESVVVESRDNDAQVAFDASADRLERAVRKALDKPRSARIRSESIRQRGGT